MTNKPSTAKNKERQDLVNDIENVRKNIFVNTDLELKWEDVNILFNKKGIEGNHWDDKWNRLPNKIGDGWKSYLMEDFDMPTEEKADGEVDARIAGVLHSLAEAVVEYLNTKITSQADSAKKKQINQKLKDYIVTYGNANEKMVYTNDPWKSLIVDADKEANKSTTSPKTAGKGWKDVGFCQKYLGDDSNELKKVGLCRKYYG